jgi:glycosyltransferase involved in cell wall biosynthesis
MKIALLSGIYPPDIGGPATHAADLADELRARGHQVVVLTVSDERRSVRRERLVAFPRRWPWALRTSAALGWLLRHRSQYEVIYATGLGPIAVTAARLTGKPVVLKVVGDPAWERARRLDLTTEEFVSFQGASGGSWRLRAMRWVRAAAVRYATVVVTPSRFLQEVVEGWSESTDVVVVPNGVRVPRLAENRQADGGDDRLSLVFVGRLVPHKRGEVLIEAMVGVDRMGLEIVGHGPARQSLEALAMDLGVSDRVTFAGALTREATMERIAGASALVSASSYEGLPHVVIEALACGRPVVTAAAGGVVEVITDGDNGVIVEPATADGFRAAFLRLRDDLAWRDGLQRRAVETGAVWSFERCADQLETLMANAVRGKPRAVFVGKTWIGEPPNQETQRKLAIHSRYLRQVSINTGPPGWRNIGGVRVVSIPRLRPSSLGGLLFYSLGPLLAVVVGAVGRNVAVVCQSPYEAVGVVLIRGLVPRRLRPRVQVELHGDWRTASRMYGGRARRLVAPLADAMCRWALRRADQVRVVSRALERQARDAGYGGPVEHYVTFSDYDVFLTDPPRPMPARPKVAFVGVLERYKAVDILLDAWSDVAAAVAGAELVVVGKGSMRAALHRRVRVAGLEGSVRFRDPMPQTELARLFDESSCLVLPSRSEGRPRVVIEAMARGRPVVATVVGGLQDLVEDGRDGRLVPAEDVMSLATALTEVLSDRRGAQRMGEEARRRVEASHPLKEYEAGIARLARWISG